MRDIYLTRDPDTALAWVCQLAADLQDEVPPEVRQLGRTLQRWSHQIARGTAPGVEQPDRSGQQPDQTRETSRIRSQELR
jgi:hypothetical protein